MSMETYVFFRGDIPDTAALTQALHNLGFPLSVVTPDYPLETQSGFMPMLWNGRETGIEFYLDEGRDRIEEIVDDPELMVGIDPALNRTASFRYALGADKYELLCLVCCPPALAMLVGGLIHNPQNLETLCSFHWVLDETRETVASVLAEIGEGDSAQDAQVEDPTAATGPLQRLRTFFSNLRRK
jgi:hypothetical protein